MSLPISICIPVLNEEKNLPSCLASLEGQFDEIIVVDSGSTDRTLEICQKAQIKTLQFYWDKTFPKKRNWALRNHQFKNPWVLFLDADERVTEAFITELREKLDNKLSGYWLSYENWFMGKKLNHGDPMRKLALFQIGHGEYEKFPEEFWTSLDMEVHEHPVLQGPLGEISAPLEHNDFRGLSAYIARHNDYSDWEAQRFLWLHSDRSDEQTWSSLNRRQRFKYENLNKWWLASFYFLISYFPKKGFLDGLTGLRFAKMKKRYFEDIRLKIIEAQRSPQ